MNIFRKLYDWTLDKAGHKKSSWFLIIISFAESSFFPIPPDVLLIPMVLANRLRAWFFALICTLSSVAGGIVGYIIGYLFYSNIGSLIVDLYGLSNSFENFESYYTQWGVWIVLGAGFTPFPFKFITIASGVFGLNIFLFIIVAVIARGLRFYLISSLLFIFGDKIKNLIDKYFNLLVSLFFILLIGSVLFLKFL
jgi:Predicted membrane protein|tara:strand:- start:448 stop:1032 length:585 start_codon:yes stop_codon:yes gene_type:complete